MMYVLEFNTKYDVDLKKWLIDKLNGLFHWNELFLKTKKLDCGICCGGKWSRKDLSYKNPSASAPTAPVGKVFLT